MSQPSVIDAPDLHLALNLLNVAHGRHYAQTRCHNVHGSVGELRNKVGALDDLLKSVDAGECEHDRSLYSPAAYFVDLMRLIADHIDGHPLLSLQARRPDLFTLALDPAACNDERAYLEQVNEAMAARLAADRSDPEHAIDEGRRLLAETVLFSSDRRVALPFNAHLESIRESLRRCGTSLASVYEALCGDDEHHIGQTVLAREKLGLSPDEYELITKSDVSEEGLERAYALRPDAAEAVDADGCIAVNTFLHVTGMTRQRLQELIAAIEHHDIRQAPGDTIEGLGAEALDMLPRFVRLAHKTGWSYRDLDAVLCMPIDEQEITPAAIRFAALTQTCQLRFDLPVETILAFAQVLPMERQGCADAPAPLLLRFFGIEPGDLPTAFDPHEQNNPEDLATRSRLRSSLGVNDGDLDRILEFMHYTGKLDSVVDLKKRGDLPQDFGHNGFLLTAAVATHLIRLKTVQDIVRLPIPDVLQLLFLASNNLDSLDDLIAVADLAQWMSALRISPLRLAEMTDDGRGLHGMSPQLAQLLTDASVRLQGVADTARDERLKPILSRLLQTRDDDFASIVALCPWPEIMSQLGEAIQAFPAASEEDRTDVARAIAGLAANLAALRLLRLSATDVALIVEHGEAFGIDPEAINGWRSLAGLQAIHAAQANGLLDGEAGTQPLVLFHDLLKACGAEGVGDDQRRHLTEEFLRALPVSSTWDLARLRTLLSDRQCMQRWLHAQPLPTAVDRLLQIRRCTELSAASGIDIGLLLRLRLTIRPVASDDGKVDPQVWAELGTLDRELAAAASGRPAPADSARLQPAESAAEKERDALTAALIHRLGRNQELIAAFGPIDSRSDLSSYLLVDVEMGAGTSVSPVKLALNSLQQYVYRCRSGQEPGVSGEIPEQRWAWMAHFRVWEANRKVFLYPENYLDPSLRRQRTPLFETLQNELRHGEITQESVQDAFTNYVGALDELARLSIVGSYCCPVIKPADHQPEHTHLFSFEATDAEHLLAQLTLKLAAAGHTANDPVELTVCEPGQRWILSIGADKFQVRRHGERLQVHRCNPPAKVDTLFLVGQAQTHPQSVFWRSVELGGDNPPKFVRWQPWQRVDVTINAESVTPVHTFGKLFLFWVERRTDARPRAPDDTGPSVKVTKASVKYTYLDLRGRWASVQSMPDMQDIELDEVKSTSPDWRSVQVVRLPPLARGREIACSLRADRSLRIRKSFTRQLL